MSTPRPTARDLFEILAREHADMLCAFLRMLVAREEVVDDLFQETMLVAWRRLDEYDRSRPLGPWLRGIAAKLVLAHRRRAGRDFLRCDPEVLEALEVRTAALDRVPADTFRGRVERLRSCIDRLPSLLREVVDLAYGRGLLLGQVAASVSANEEAIKKRLQRARLMLSQCLEAQGGGS